jgi:hypothetical protein
MVVIVLMLVSFALIGVILVAAFVTVQRETERSREARQRMKDLRPAFNFVALEPLEPLEPRIDPKDIHSYKETLSRVLVSDYLQSGDIRRIVDEALPRRGYRRDFGPIDPGPPSS